MFVGSKRNFLLIYRRQALLKAGAMYHNVGFPDELLNDTVLDEMYKGVDVHADRLLENILQLSKHNQLRAAKMFQTSVKKHDWTSFGGFADVVNAFYNHGDNSLGACCVAVEWGCCRQ